MSSSWPRPRASSIAIASWAVRSRRTRVLWVVGAAPIVLGEDPFGFLDVGITEVSLLLSQPESHEKAASVSRCPVAAMEVVDDIGEFTFN
jgi:hypothetical protein